VKSTLLERDDNYQNFKQLQGELNKIKQIQQQIIEVENDRIGADGVPTSAAKLY
jgi:uncharacterized protein (UPF0276 family)